MLSPGLQPFSALRTVDIITAMNKTNFTVLPPEESLADLAHLAWCALVALHTARQDGRARSALAVHAFLVSWLATAQKQRRFPRSVATDIDSLLRLGRQNGLAANLQQRLEYLWQSCSGPVAQQSALFRLTYAIEQLKSQGWLNAVVADDEWMRDSLLAEYTDVRALLVKKSELTRHFSEAGELLYPLTFQVTGDIGNVTNTFRTFELRFSLPSVQAEHATLVLMPVC